jgi:hypothetical protein
LFLFVALSLHQILKYSLKSQVLFDRQRRCQKSA